MSITAEPHRPITSEKTAPSVSWDAMLGTLADAASCGIRVYPSVARADFSITGAPGELSVSVDLVVMAGGDSSRILREVDDEVLPGLEKIVGHEFAQRDLNLQVIEKPLVIDARDELTKAA